MNVSGSQKQNSWALVCPELLQRILNTLDPEASLASDAADYLADIFNQRTHRAVLDICHAAANRGLLTKAATQHYTSEQREGKETNAAVASQSVMDASGAGIDISDVARFLTLPSNSVFSLPSAQETRVLGRIKRFTPSLLHAEAIKKSAKHSTTTVEQAEAFQHSPIASAVDNQNVAVVSSAAPDSL